MLILIFQAAEVTVQQKTLFGDLFLGFRIQNFQPFNKQSAN